MVNKREWVQEIRDLIALGAEGDYWDYKQQWYSNNSDLLHDIICMANNTVDHDGYIIVGIEDGTGKIHGGIDTDSNRKSQQNIIDFLKNRKFAGGVRPTVYVKTISFDSDGIQYEIDVIIIKNTDRTPYYLIDNDMGVLANHIYTRVGDTNTPKCSTADIDKVEHLWKKRFGVDKTPFEKLKQLLSYPLDWLPMGTDGEHSSNGHYFTWYNKLYPEYTISYEIDKSRFDNGQINAVEQGMYWMDRLPDPLHNSYIYEVQVKYHSTIMYSTLAVFADNFRFERVLWKKDIFFENNLSQNILYCYVEADSIEFQLDKWLANHCDTIWKTEHSEYVSPLQPWVSQPEYSGYNPYCVVPVFRDGEEHQEFRKYVDRRKEDLLQAVGSWEPTDSRKYAVCSDPIYIEWLCKIGETLVRWLEDWRFGDG